MDVDGAVWGLVQGGRTALPHDDSCGTVSEGRSLYFGSTSGLRMLETVDLDLRDAR